MPLRISPFNFGLSLGRRLGSYGRSAVNLARRVKLPRLRLPLARYALIGFGTLVVVGFAAFALGSRPVSPGSTEKVIFEVRPGDGAATIASALEEKGLIRASLEFRAFSAVFGWNGRLQAGRYELSPGYSTLRILKQISRGEVLTMSVVIPEGYTVAQIETLLVDKGLATPDTFRQALATVAAEGAMPFMPSEPRPYIEPYEGLLFPDTYYYGDGTGAEVILRSMARRMTEVFTPGLLARAEELKMTPFEVLTLASIIEKEARVDQERAIISSVYHNRLNIGMGLGACPTVFYVLGKPASEPLLFADLEVDSPYNTYKYAGLPPGPICSPGLASIKAALYPADTDYYYFVAKNDGTHAFARTLEEHNRNVALYQGGH